MSKKKNTHDRKEKERELSRPLTVRNLTPCLHVVTTSQVEPVPEPATMFLLGTGLALVAATVRKRSKGC